MSHLFLTWRVPRLLGLALVSWAIARIGVHRPSLSLPYFVFSIRSYLPLDFNRVSSLRPTYRHPFGHLHITGAEICLLLISNVNIESLCSTKICDSICHETFHAVYYFLLFLAWVKKILPIFHFTMLAGLLNGFTRN